MAGVNACSRRIMPADGALRAGKTQRKGQEPPPAAEDGQWVSPPLG